jgi:hypothetical protein
MDRLDGFVTASVVAALIGLARGGFEAPAAACWYGELMKPDTRAASTAERAPTERTVTLLGATGSIGTAPSICSSASASAFASRR